jgi:NAD(P)-dependent dehydrogenase (short-subunit alcohol dehydrogenase family)
MSSTKPIKKIALITGGTSGLGKAMAKALSVNGFMVYAAGRDTSSSSNIKNLQYIYLDVTNYEIIKSAVGNIIQTYGQIDLLINCAGIGVAASIEEIPMKEIHDAFDVNLYGTVRLIKEVVPYMREKGAGKIVNISSIGGLVALPFQGIYCSTKFALEGLTEALSMELKPFGIYVSLIEPGDYNTKVAANRTVVKPKDDSPYKTRLKTFFDRLAVNIQKGQNPDIIGDLIVKIAHTEKPKLRYKSGRFYEKITPLVKTLLPFRLFSRILIFFYKL